MHIENLATPCLIVNRTIVEKNISRMKACASRHGVRLRAHVKTTKSIDIAKLLVDNDNPGVTVSTLREAEYFSENGITDILYAVSIVPSKVARVAALYKKGVCVQLILDSLETATEVSRQAEQMGVVFEVLIEIDTDGHRAGIEPYDSALLAIGQVLDASAGINFLGVMTHAGDAYDCTSLDSIRQHAEQERSRCVSAAERLRGAGIECKVVSVGSTPTVMCADNFKGCTEIRAGVFIFCDLFQAGLGVCDIGDIGLSVLTTVISHKHSHKRLIVDAGGMALSKDRGTASQPVDCGYGLVADAASGKVIPGLQVSAANQEHGMIELSHTADFDQYPIGSQLRIFPNHACMTAAAHDRYFVIEGGDHIVAEWGRCHGW